MAAAAAAARAAAADKIIRACRTISRFLFFISEATVIHLDSRLLSSSSDLPGSRNGAGRSSSPIWSCSTWGLPCQRALLPPRCALTAPFHPYPAKYIPGGIVFCGTFRKTRFERVSPAVSRHAALRRPDFPPGGVRKRHLGRLSVRQARFLLSRFRGYDCNFIILETQRLSAESSR